MSLPQEVSGILAELSHQVGDTSVARAIRRRKRPSGAVVQPATQSKGLVDEAGTDAEPRVPYMTDTQLLRHLVPQLQRKPVVWSSIPQPVAERAVHAAGVSDPAAAHTGADADALKEQCFAVGENLLTLAALTQALGPANANKAGAGGGGAGQGAGARYRVGGNRDGGLGGGDGAAEARKDALVARAILKRYGQAVEIDPEIAYKVVTRQQVTSEEARPSIRRLSDLGSRLRVSNRLLGLARSMRDRRPAGTEEVDAQPLPPIAGMAQLKPAGTDE